MGLNPLENRNRSPDTIIYWRYWPAIQESTYLIIFSR